MKSFDNNDKFFEDRFNPKKRTIGESQLREHDQGKKHLPTSKIFQIEFSESVPEGIKSFLNERLPEILDFPIKFGLNIQSAKHLLRFIDQSSYEDETGSLLPKKVSLPASRIKYFSNSRSFKVVIILPKKLDTAEGIINITRNLFSKLYGNIFLAERILPHEFYKQTLYEREQITAAVPEILDLASVPNLISETLDNYCESIAESYRLSLEKQGGEIRKQLAKEWRVKWQENALTAEEQYTIDSMFAEFKDSIRTNPEKIINYMIECVKKLNTQLHYILPHEKGYYENMEKKHITHYIRSVLNKLEEISSLAGFIEELHSELDNFSGSTELKGIRTQIRYRMQQLIRDKKVKKFYVHDITLDEETESMRQKFPLVLAKMIPKGTPLKDWSKTVTLLEKHYSESIYSKLYSALYCLNILTSERNNFKRDEIKSSETAQKMKKLLSVLKYRSREIKTTQSVLGIFLEINKQSVSATEEKVGKQIQFLPLDELKTAWSYFIASVLTLIYYQESDKSLPQGFKADNYTKSILRYVDKQCSRGINHFHIVKLLWLIFDEKKDSGALTFLLYCLQNPQGIMRFILNQVIRPQSENLSLERRLKKLPRYAKIWITAFQNRLDEVTL